jgi:hypothetical protein
MSSICNILTEMMMVNIGYKRAEKPTDEIVRGASKIKLKNVNKKRMDTARRQIFLGISQGIHC